MHYTTRRHHPEDTSLQKHRRVSFISHDLLLFVLSSSSNIYSVHSLSSDFTANISSLLQSLQQYKTHYNSASHHNLKKKTVQ